MLLITRTYKITVSNTTLEACCIFMKRLHIHLLIVSYDQIQQQSPLTPQFPNATTALKVSKYGVISGPYFPVFGLNTGKYGPEMTPYLDTFHAVYLDHYN